MNISTKPFQEVLLLLPLISDAKIAIPFEIGNR